MLNTVRFRHGIWPSRPRATHGFMETEGMTRTELVARIAARLHLTGRQSGIIVDTVLDCIAEALAEGDKVELRGFGSFRTRSREARNGRNPRTGETVQVPRRKAPFFRASKAFLEKLQPPDSR